MGSLSESDFTHLLKSRCIGLTGGIATGKSTVAAILRTLAFIVIDADQLARDVTLPGEATLDSIKRRFGPEVILADGSLDRDALRKIVMADPAERKALEAITHPAIHQKFKEKIEASNIPGSSSVFFYEAALLFETGRDGLFKEIWATTCPEELQLERLVKRSGLSPDDAQKMLASQMPASLKAKKSTKVIDTNCGLDELRGKVQALLHTR